MFSSMASMIVVIVLSFVYIAINFTNPITQSELTLQLTEVQIRLLQLSISVPFVLSWSAGAMGSQELRKYAQHLKDKDQQAAFQKIAFGILILVLSSILPAVLGVVRTRFFNTPELVPIMTIITNYFYAFPPLFGLWLIFSATKSLARSVKAPTLPPLGLALALIFPVSLAIVNAVLVFTNPNRQFAEMDIRASYYLPDTVIVGTILIPSALSWLFGSLAMLYAQHYSKFATGTVFRSAINRFITGLFLVVTASIVLQLLLALGPARLEDLGLTGLLVVVYVFIALQTLGYILIAIGSQKFSLVEQILSKYTNRNSHGTAS